MKVKILAATVSAISLTWLGMSFATPSEASEDTHFSSFTAQEFVPAEHPDSHRLGEAAEGSVALPAWEEAGTASELALLAD